MRVMITGAAGFIGRAVLAALERKGSLRDGEGREWPIEEAVLVDLKAPSALFAAGSIALRPVAAELGTVNAKDLIADHRPDVVFHLAATLTADAESDFERGLAVNLEAMLHLLERARRAGTRPRVVYASSIAAFGGRLDEVVSDATPRTPQTSYGTHKAVAELMLTDYSRRGFLDGRALRLPVVLTRPAGASSAISDQIAAIVREPLHGRPARCPLAPATRIPVASVRRCAEGLVALADVPEASLGDFRSLNFPALTISLGEMIAEVERRAGEGLISIEPDSRLQAVVDGWPKVLAADKARALGIVGDASFADLVESYLRDARGR